MTEKPDPPRKELLEPSDEDMDAPPEPERIWPPPETPAEGEIIDRWEEDADHIDGTIEEIRRLSAERAAEGEPIPHTTPEPVPPEGPAAVNRAPEAEVETWAPQPPPSSEEEEVHVSPEPTSEQVESILAGQAPAVPGERAAPALEVTCHLNAKSQSEIGRLWGNVFFSAEHAPPRSIIVTAGRGGDGATQIATSLALIGAETNDELRIVLVDFNLRRPGVASTLGLEARPGLSEVLAGEVSLAQAIQALRLENGNVLYVLTSGGAAAHPLRLVRSSQVRTVVEQLQTRYDHTILDTASADMHPDAQVIGAMVDGVLLVVRGGSTPRETVAEAKKRLDLAGVRCLGLVLNRRTDPVPGILYRIT